MSYFQLYRVNFGKRSLTSHRSFLQKFDVKLFPLPCVNHMCVVSRHNKEMRKDINDKVDKLEIFTRDNLPRWHAIVCERISFYHSVTSENQWERPHSPAIRTKMVASNTLKILRTKPNFSKTKNIRRKLIPVPKSRNQDLSSKQHLFWDWSVPLSLKCVGRRKCSLCFYI